MMLHSTRQGYAVMSKELDSYSLQHYDLDICKKYCRNDDVIAERIPYKYGISISFRWFEPYKFIEFELIRKRLNVSYLHISWESIFTHKTGKVIYKPKKE